MFKEPAFFEIIQCFGAVFFAAILLFVFIARNKFFNHQILRGFIVIEIVIVLLSIVDAGQAYYESLSYSTNMRMFFASSGYALRPLILCSLVAIYMRNYSLKIRRIIMIPAILNAIVSFLAFIPGNLIFYYTPENELIRGPLIVVPFIVSLLYFIAVLVASFARQNGKLNNEGLLLIILFGISIIGTLMELKYRFRAILPSISIVGLIFYYMFFLSNNYSIDQLTGTFVRTKLYEDILRIKKSYGVIEIDVNGLKEINDTKGHLFGDNCLKQIINATRECLPSSADIYRIGGDEFIIIYRTYNEEKVLKLVSLIRKKVDEVGFSVAIGYSMKLVDESYDNAESRADKNMYIDKSIYKNSIKNASTN